MKRALFSLVAFFFLACGGAESSVEWILEVDQEGASSKARRVAAVEAASVLRARIGASMEGTGLVGSVEEVGDGRILVRLSGYRAETMPMEPLFRVGNVALHRLRDDVDLWAIFPQLDSVVEAHALEAQPPGLGGLVPMGDDTDQAPVRMDTTASSTDGGGVSGGASPAGRSRGAGIVMVDQPHHGRHLTRAAMAGPIDDFLKGSQADGTTSPPVTIAWGPPMPSGGGEPMVWLYVLDDEPMMTSDDVEDAFAGDLVGGPGVAFSLTLSGEERVGRVSKRHVGEPLAIVVDGQVVSEPVIRDQIGGQGKFDAPADMSDPELYALGLFLRFGPLPAPLVVVEGPTFR